MTAVGLSLYFGLQALALLLAVSVPPLLLGIAAAVVVAGVVFDARGLLEIRRP